MSSPENLPATYWVDFVFRFTYLGKARCLWTEAYLRGTSFISLILLCISQYRWQYAISRMQSISHSLAIDRDTHHREREKKSGQEDPPAPVKYWNIGVMDRISVQPQVKLTWLRSPSLQIVPLSTYVFTTIHSNLQYCMCIHVCTVPKFKILLLLFWKLWASFLRKYMFCNFSSYPTSSWGGWRVLTFDSLWRLV